MNSNAAQLSKIIQISLFSLNEWRVKGLLPSELRENRQPVNLKQKRGLYTHAILKEITGIPADEFPDVSSLINKWNKLCEGKIKKRGRIFAEMIEFGSRVMPAFWSEREFRRSPRLLEHRVSSQINFSSNNGLQVIFNGRIDRIDFIDEKREKVKSLDKAMSDPVEIIDYKAREAPRADAHKNLRLKTSAAAYSLLYRLKFGRWPWRVTFLFLEGMVRVVFYPAELNFFNLIFEPLRLIVQETLDKPIERLCDFGDLIDLEELFIAKKVPCLLEISKIPDIWDRNGVIIRPPLPPKFQELELFPKEGAEVRV